MRAHTSCTRAAVWAVLADQFLDTEMRDAIPRAAASCLEAGLSVKEARDVWRYEVAPAVWPNVWDVAGEWGGWPEDWLVETVERLRGRWPNRPGVLCNAIYRLRVHLLHGCWIAIESCMGALAARPVEERPALVADLTLLARRYFGFGREDEVVPTRARRRELEALYEGTFLAAFRTVTPEAGHLEGDGRVRALLAGGGVDR